MAGTNAGTWGDGASTSLNAGVIQVVDSNMAGVIPYSLSSSNVVMSATDTRNCLFRLTGTLLANITLTQAGGALFNGFYYFENLTTGNFTVTLTTGAGSLVLLQNRVGVVFVDATNGPRYVSAPATPSTPDVIPAGTVMLFFQAAAPTGWSQIAAQNDYGLKIVSGTGGGTSGTVAYSTLFARTATDGYALLINDIPSHSHTVSVVGGSSFSGFNSFQETVVPGTSITYTSSSVGGGASHSHGLDMRLQTANLIQCSKN